MCPKGVDPIQATDAARAYEAVLAHDHASPEQLVEQSVRPADQAGDRGGPVGYGCGRLTAERTFVVEARWSNAGTSESLAQSVTYVSHRGDIWFVWAEPH